MAPNHLLTKTRIKADASGNAPSSIELLKTGSWETPFHGDFEITEADLHEYAANFANGVGLVEQDKKAPIDYAHDMAGKAAGWITRLRVSDDGQTLIGDGVTWTPAAEQAIKDGEWKYISSEFNPRGMPWFDAEGSEDGDNITFINNVLTGAALTNIPLFKKLKPIMASRVPTKKTVKADATGDSDKHKGERMTLEEIRAKDVASVTDEEKTFLADHKADLTADELTKYGLEATDDDAAKAAAEKEAADKAKAEQEAKEAADKAAAEAKASEEAAKVEASAKPVSISADRLAKLEADAQAGREAQQKLARNEAEAFVSASVRAGQIKSGEKDRAVELLLASSGKQRTELESFIKGLPANELLGKEIGDAGQAVSTGAHEELHQKTVASIKASADKGQNIAYSQARKDILAADSELAKRVKQEEEEK